MKKLKKLDEAQAWSVLLRIFDGRNGVCGAIYGLLVSGLISATTYHAMTCCVRRERARQGDKPVMYLWPTDKTADRDCPRYEFVEAEAAAALKRKQRGHKKK